MINPLAYRGYEELGATTGYSEEDYTLFKQTALTAATAYSTNAKEGCENEFGLFVETERDLYLPDLSQYIQFEKSQDKNIIRITCSELINSLSDKIKSVEIYINSDTTKLESDIKGAKIYNIFTQKEV